MPSERISTTLAASAVNNNILQGSIYEFMSRPTRVVIAASAGTTPNVANIGVNFGSRTMAQVANTEVPMEPGAGQGPRLPDDVIVDDIAMPGERIVISLQDQGAVGGTVTRTLVQFTEVA